MKNRTSLIHLVFVICFLPTLASAKNFSNAYISFEMQDGWDCKLEQTEWVCRSLDVIEAKEAVIILTAKEKGPTDSFPQYQVHMNESITTTTRAGVQMNSTIKYKAREVKINDQPWLDGFHQDSEVQNYFTRYLATIKDQVAILVTFSAHNKSFAKHSTNFERAVQSLRVLAVKNILDKNTGPFGKGTNEIYSDPESGRIIASENERLNNSGGFFGSSLKKKVVAGFSVLFLGLFAFVYLRMRKKS